MKDINDDFGPHGQFLAIKIGWNKQWDPFKGKIANEYDFGIIQVGKQHIKNFA